MLSSVDGKIDGAALGAVTSDGEYEATGAKLNGDAWICGRTTMQQHFAEDEPFVSSSNTPAGPQPVFVARQAESYAISVDTLGKLRWPDGDLDGDQLICVVSEQVPDDYLAMLREKRISCIVSGKSSVDLAGSSVRNSWKEADMMISAFLDRHAGCTKFTPFLKAGLPSNSIQFS
jgi:2,5-diamino-6-(ribosylamino)-4(3H)-pyrimidinone 5'-phosphate reductase